jgi:hypothetical protein
MNIMADMILTERSAAIAEYRKCKELVDRLERELEIAQNDLELAIDTLDTMGVVEYQ